VSINDRAFDVYVVLGDPQQPPAWSAPVWAKIVPLLDPLIKTARDKAAVRSTQVRCDAGSPNQSDIRFGRIGWNAAGHRKWVHGDRSEGKSIEFVDVEVWAPSWTVCERESRAPDLFFKMKNEQSALGEVVTFNPVLLLALAADQPENVRDTGLVAAAGLSDVCSALLRVRRRRNWGYRLDHPDRENAILDYSPFRVGPRHDRPVSLDLFERVWEPF
jgi:hypothetical protein